MEIIENWTTQFEINFLTELMYRNRKSFRRYARIILENRRRWDPGIDVAAIRRHVKKLTNEIIRQELEAEGL